MDLGTYYSILKWRGEDPTKIDPEDSSKKEFGRKIFEQDIDLGKVAWTGHRLRDFRYYIIYYNPFLAMCANVKRLDISDIFIVLSVLFNVSTFTAAITSTIGYKVFTESNASNPFQLSIIDIMTMAFLAAFNGVILCFMSLNWRSFERYKEEKMLVILDHYNTLIVGMFIAMSLNVGWYLMTRQMAFFSWFITIYTLEVVFALVFEFSWLRIRFNRGWRRDIAMVQLDVFVHYYLTFKDYQEWREYIEEIEENKRMEATVHDSDVAGDEESLLEEPLLNR